MNETLDPFIDALLEATDPLPLLAQPLPWPPLTIQAALHDRVVKHMRDEMALAARAADLVELIAQHNSDDPLLRAQAHWSRGTAILYQPAYREALNHYDQALALYDEACARLAPAQPARDLRIIQIVRVFCLNELGRFAEALKAAKVADAWLVQNPNPQAHLTLALNCSLLAGNMGDYAAMRDQAAQVVALAVELHRHDYQAMGLVNLTLALTMLGELDEAEHAVIKAIAIAIDADEQLTHARALVNQATLLRIRGHLVEAIALLDQAELGLHEAPGEAATVALEMALIYNQLYRFDEARRAAQRAAEGFAAQAMPAYSAEAYLWAARNALRDNKPLLARQLLEAARTQTAGRGLSIIDAMLAATRARIFILERQRGKSRDKLPDVKADIRNAIRTLTTAGIVEEAIEAQLASAALEAATGKHSRARDMYHALMRSAPSLQQQLEAHTALAQWADPAEAIDRLQAGVDLAATIRRTLSIEELKAHYSSKTAHHHARLTAAQLAQGNLEAALQTIFDAKAAPLIELRVAESRLPGPMKELDPLRHTLARLRAKEREQKHRLTELPPATSAADVARSEYKATEADLQATEQELLEAAQRLTPRHGHGVVPTYAELTARLRPDEAILEFAELPDTLGCFIVRADASPIYRRLGSLEAFTTAFAQWNLVRQSTLGHSYGQSAASDRHELLLAQLSRLCLTPIAADLAGITRLLIAPTGNLYHVPWAALRIDGVTLAERYTLTLTPSSAFWAAPLPPGKTPPGPPLLLGYAGPPERHLAGVAPELAAIQSVLPTAQIKLEASRADLFTATPPAILHIAAHALTRPKTPICSSIELSDGPFLLLEAHRLNLRGTTIVGLSACETGERPDYGEMTLAIAGAFLCAGARLVLASLWAVDDSAATALMSRFYAAYAQGSEPAEALRRAQNELRADYPLDWAAFQLWAGSPPEIPRHAG